MTKLLQLAASVIFTTASFGAINLNTATVEELDSLPGVGKITAERIIEMRPILELDNLLSIRGMKQDEIDVLRDLVTIGDTAKDCPTANSVATTQPSPTVSPKLESVTTTKPVSVPLHRDGKQIGSMTLPAGTKLAVVSQTTETITVRHSSGATVTITAADVVEPLSASAPEPTPSSPKATPALPAGKIITSSPAPFVEQEFVVSEPTMFSSIQTPPPDAPKKKILVVPSMNTSIVSQVALAQALRKAGHQVDYEDNGYGSGRVRRSGIGGGPPVEIHPRQSEIFGWPATTNPNFVAYDAIIAGGGTSDLKRPLLEAIQRGQLVILETDQGPWAYSHSKDAAKDAEKAYLADQVRKGLLSQQPADQLGSNSYWEMAPWANPENPAQLTEGGTRAKRSSIRPTDIVPFENILTYNLDPSSRSGKFSAGYSGIHYPEAGKNQGWSEAFQLDFTKRYLLPVVQSALSTHIPKPVVFTKKELTPAPGVPIRPTLPRSFPLPRPTEEGTVVAWGLSSAPGARSRTEELIPIPEGLTAVQVTATAGMTASKIHCLALKKDGTVVAWGWNGEGQCDVPPELTNVVSVAAGEGVSLALKADGTITVWGGGKLFSFIPKDLSNIVQAAFIGDGAVFLTADGNCRFISENHGEEAGPVENFRQKDGSVIRKPRNMTPGWERIISTGNLVSIAGGRYGYGLTAQGEVVVFNSNDDPAGMVPNDLGPVAALPIVPDYCDYVAAIQIDGTVRAWGRNDSGQCDVPNDLPPVQSLSTAPSHVAAITTGGKLVTWGWNWQGEQNVPTELENVRFLSAFAGDGFTLAIVQKPTP